MFKMKLLWFLLFSFSICSQLNEQAVFSSQIEVRNATLEDLDDITDSVIAAYSNSDWFNYIHQFREKYPEEHRQCYRLMVVEAFNDPNAILQTVKMSTGEVNSDEKAIACGLWVFPGSELAASMVTLSSLDGCTHQDMNMTRQAASGKILHAGKQKYIDDVFTTHHIYLGGLVTHPDFQGRGVASAILRSGIAMGQERGLNLTLVATEAGEPVYKHMGFESIANLTVPTLEGDQSFRFDVMFFNISSPIV